MASQSVGDAAAQPPTLTPQPPYAFKVEFWVLGSAASLGNVQRAWQLFDTCWATRWDQIPGLVAEWESMGGVWSRSQLRIEEHELCSDRSGHYVPVNRM